MANLKIEDQIIKIKVGQNILEDVPLYEIDRLIMACGKDFIKQAFYSNVIDKKTYQNHNIKISITCDNTILEPVFFDPKLSKVAKSLHNNNGIITNDNEEFKSDINFLFKMLNLEPKKVVDYFKNNQTLVDSLKNYKEASLEIIDYFKDYYNYRILRNFIKENTSILALTINSNNTKYKVLYEDINNTVDEYTMKFKNSNEIRDKYQLTIIDYLKENEDFLNKSTRKNNGAVVILENNKFGMSRKRVLYKDTKNKIDAFTKNLKEVKELSRIDCKSNFFSECERKMIKYQIPGKRTGYVGMMKDWSKKLFEDKNYDLIRSVLHFVDQGYLFINEKHELKPVESKPLIIKEDEEFLYDEELEMMKGDNDYTYDYHNIKER